MARTLKIKRSGPKGGRFSWVALTLLFISLVGFIIAMLPKSVESMWQRTLSDLNRREDTLAFLSRTLRSGSVVITGEGEGANSAEGIFALPDGASLAVTGGSEFLLCTSNDGLTLRQGEESASASARYALEAYDASHFAGEKDDAALTLRRFLLLTESRDDAGAVLAPYYKAVKRYLPRRTDESVTTEEGAETVISYELDAKRLGAILTEWQKILPGDEALRSLTADFIRSCYAANGESAPQELINRIMDFLTGGDGNQALLATGFAGGKGSVKLSFRVVSDRVRGIRAAWDLPMGGENHQGALELDLGRDPARSAVRSFALLDKKIQGDQEQTLTLSLKDAVTENGNNAFVREAEFSLEDPGFLLLPQTEGDNGTRSVKLKFSWGKKRGDLGFRIATPEKTIQFRGELKDYNAGNRAEFVLRRVEIDGENRIPDQSYTFVLKAGGGTPATAALSETDLFRAPEQEAAPEGGEAPAPDGGEAQEPAA